MNPDIVLQRAAERERELALRRQRELEHSRLRLRDRYGVNWGEADIRDLAAAAKDRGQPVAGASTSIPRSVWLDVRFRGRTIRLCLDGDTGMVCTVVPPHWVLTTTPMAMRRARA